VRVLGVDPGTIVTGWGVVDCNSRRFVHVASGTIAVGRGELAERLAMIYAQISTVIGKHKPTIMSLERNFLARNVQSAFRLGEARGVLMAAAAGAGIVLSEYTPATIKKAVVGHGRADKAQVQDAIARLLALEFEPKSDEADALAAATCYGLHHGYDSKLADALGGRRLGRGNSRRRWAAVAAARGGRRENT